MPKSRGRRKPRQNRSHGSRTHSTRSGANLDLLPLLQATDLAEARGDAAVALEIIERDIQCRRDLRFWRPERLQRLLQLDVYGPLLPRWATSRWILDQAAQQLDPGFRGRASQALEIAIGVRGAETLVGVDELDARCKVMDHDWVYRQVLLYELGALRRFLARGAAADLVAGADRIHEWAHAPMGAFRLLEETPRTLRWLDLGTGTSRESTNIGAASLLEAGECAIGRLAYRSTSRS